jgi:hypothetical protein
MGANALGISDSSFHHNMGSNWCLRYTVGLGLRDVFHVLGIDGSFRIFSMLFNWVFVDAGFEQVQSG